MSHWGCRLALIAVLIGSSGAELGIANDGALTIEQVPPDKRERPDERGERALLPEGVPERCADPTVASEDPACLPTREPVGESYGIPVIRDTREDGEDLIPGVTINQGRGGR